MKILTNKKLDKIILKAEEQWGKNPEYYPFVIIGKNYKIIANITSKENLLECDGKTKYISTFYYKNLKITQVFNEVYTGKNEIYYGYTPINPCKNNKECYGTILPYFSNLKLS